MKLVKDIEKDTKHSEKISEKEAEEIEQSRPEKEWGGEERQREAEPAPPTCEELATAPFIQKKMERCGLCGAMWLHWRPVTAMAPRSSEAKHRNKAAHMENGNGGCKDAHGSQRQKGGGKGQNKRSHGRWGGNRRTYRGPIWNWFGPAVKNGQRAQIDKQERRPLRHLSPPRKVEQSGLCSESGPCSPK